jgi:hypothetical protein
MEIHEVTIKRGWDQKIQAKRRWMLNHFEIRIFCTCRDCSSDAGSQLSDRRGSESRASSARSIHLICSSENQARVHLNLFSMSGDLSISRNSTWRRFEFQHSAFVGLLIRNRLSHQDFLQNDIVSWPDLDTDMSRKTIHLRRIYQCPGKLYSFHV